MNAGTGIEVVCTAILTVEPAAGWCRCQHVPPSTLGPTQPGVASWVLPCGGQLLPVPKTHLQLFACIVCGHVTFDPSLIVGNVGSSAG